MAKTIVFCADGTWNGPGKDDAQGAEPKGNDTNVYKLFLALAGGLSTGSIREADEQEKVLVVNGATTQVTKYIHGVGDSRNPIFKLMGGAFGAGTISRIVRGYTYISRNYEPGDAIVITGFSRGAYTARALAGLIAGEGLLAKPLAANGTEEERANAYRNGARAWYRYRDRSNAMSNNPFKRFAEVMADLPAFVSSSELIDSDLVPVASLKSVAVWDTVGALGLPSYDKDHRTDAFRFTNNTLSPKVEKGLHAIALDEQRNDFTPSLWDAAANVEQCAFAGAHADVGGGYPLAGNESGLSDISLKWMVEKLQAQGVSFVLPLPASVVPNVCGTAHKPWLHAPFNLPGAACARALAGQGVQVHPSVQQRMQAGPVVAEPGEAVSAYQPANLP